MQLDYTARRAVNPVVVKFLEVSSLAVISLASALAAGLLLMRFFLGHWDGIEQATTIGRAMAGVAFAGTALMVGRKTLRVGADALSEFLDALERWEWFTSLSPARVLVVCAVIVIGAITMVIVPAWRSDHQSTAQTKSPQATM